MSLRFIEMITGRLAQTFQELNQVIREEMDRRQSQVSTNPPNDPQLEPNRPSEVSPNKSQPEGHEKGESQIEEAESQRKNERPEKVDKAKSKKNLTGHRPKKPQNAFKFYLQQMKKNASGSDVGEVTKIASKKWEMMGEDQKQQYLELQQKEKNRYDSELDVFYQKNPEQKEKDMDKKEKKVMKRKQKEEEKQKEKDKETRSKKKEKDQKYPSPRMTPRRAQSKLSSEKEPLGSKEVDLEKQQIQQNGNRQQMEEVPEDKAERIQMMKEAPQQGIDQFLNFGGEKGDSDSLGADI